MQRALPSLFIFSFWLLVQQMSRTIRCILHITNAETLLPDAALLYEYLNSPGIRGPCLTGQFERGRA